MSDFWKTLIIQGFEANVILLKMWFFLIMSSTISNVIEVLVFSPKYGISMILKYNFD